MNKNQQDNDYIESIMAFLRVVFEVQDTALRDRIVEAFDRVHAETHQQGLDAGREIARSVHEGDLDDLPVHPSEVIFTIERET